MPPAATKRDLIDRLMGGRFEKYVDERRNGVPQRSWVGIAGDLRVDHGIDVTDEALRKWFSHLDRGRGDARST